MVTPRFPRWPGLAGTARLAYALHIWTVFGLAVSNGAIALTALAATPAVGWRRVPWRRLAGVVTPFAAYLGVLALSIAASQQPLRSLRAVGEVSSLASVFFALVLLRGEREVRRVARGLVVAAAILAAAGLAQLALGFGDLEHRIRGPFSHYMTFAGVLLVADLLLVAEMVCGRGGRSPWRWVALALINLALVGSLTRSAWVAAILSFTLLLLLRAPRYLAAYLPAGVLFFLLAPVPVLHRAVSIFDLKDISNYDRLCMVEAGLHMLAERPLLGQGPDMVESRYALYRHPTSPRTAVPHLHNTLIHLAAERGLAGVAVYAWLMGGSLWLAIRGYRRARRAGEAAVDLHMGALLGLVAFNLAGLFENNWGDSEVQRLALFLVAIPYCLAAEPPAGAGAGGAAAVDTLPPRGEEPGCERPCAPPGTGG